MKASDPTAPTFPSPRRARRSGVATLLALVGACALWTSVGLDRWRDYQEPAGAVARQLDSHSQEVRLGAATDLARFAAMPSGLAMTRLAKALGDTDPRVRAAAVGSLGPMIGAATRTGTYHRQAQAAAARLVDTLADPVPAVRIAAATALPPIFPAGPATRTGTPIPPPPIDPAEAIQALSRLMVDPDPSVRATTIDVMRGLGREVPIEASPTLLMALQSPDPETRTNAARVIATFQKGTETALPALFRLVEEVPEGDPGLSRPDVQAAWTALRSLHMQPTAVPYLKGRLADERRDVRAAVAALLGRIGGGADAATPGLLAVLREPESGGTARVPIPPGPGELVRVDPAAAAALALGHIGAATARSRGAIVTGLREMVRTGSPVRRAAAAGALAEIRQVNRFAEEVTAMLTPAVPELADALRKALDARRPVGEQRDLIRALGVLAHGTSQASVAVAVLHRSLSSGEVRTIEPAVLSLAAFGPDAAEALPSLFRLRDTPELRPSVQRAIDMIEDR